MTQPLIMSWYSILDELKEFVLEIENKLTEKERQRMELELDLIEENIEEREHHKVSEALIHLLKKENIEPITDNVMEVLTRMYDISGFGCKSSCISSVNIVLETQRVLLDEGLNSCHFISGKGHMAPMLYANEYTESNFSLLYLYALHHSNIISPVLSEKYTSKGVDVHYNLGYGLPKVLSMMMSNPDKKYVLLLGDSDLTFSATLEALMFIKTYNYNNLTLLIDFNKFGFEARPDGFDTKILNSFFDDIIELDEYELHSSSKLKEIIASDQRGAVFIHTKKEHHRITLFSAKKKKVVDTVKLTTAYAKSVAFLNERYDKELLIFTPDLASRFALQEHNLNYVNTTVSEALTPILALKQDGLTAIATDQKYSTNMIGSILELYKDTGRVLLTLAKSWDYWGGEANALNILNTLPEVTVYEPCSSQELLELLENHYLYSSYKTIISVADVDLPSISFTPNMNKPNHLLSYGSKKVIVSFGMATALVYDVSKRLNIDLIHFTKMRPNYSEEFEQVLNNYTHVHLMEYNGVRNGFSEHFLSQYNIDSYSIISAYDTIPQMKAIDQIDYHGFSSKKLTAALKKQV